MTPLKAMAASYKPITPFRTLRSVGAVQRVTTTHQPQLSNGDWNEMFSKAKSADISDRAASYESLVKAIVTTHPTNFRSKARHCVEIVKTGLTSPNVRIVIISLLAALELLRRHGTDDHLHEVFPFVLALGGVVGQKLKIMHGCADAVAAVRERFGVAGLLAACESALGSEQQGATKIHIGSVCLLSEMDEFAWASYANSDTSTFI